jgi:hypothetical protein
MRKRLSISKNFKKITDAQAKMISLKANSIKDKKAIISM